MRAATAGSLVAVLLVLAVGTAVASAPPSSGEAALPVQGVTGSLTLDPIVSLGTFSTDAGVHQHRDVPLSGSQLAIDDARLSGQVDAIWNWDIYRSGTEPVPAWGTMRITQADDSAWAGTFTGIRRHDNEPFTVRAFLVGEGAYEGLCAVLDIDAGTGAWALDGVIHRLPMAD